MSYNSAVECMIDNREAESSNLSRTTNFNSLRGRIGYPALCKSESPYGDVSSSLIAASIYKVGEKH